MSIIGEKEAWLAWWRILGMSDEMMRSENNVELEFLECVERHESFAVILPCVG